jgi:hypothetical protein
VPIQRVTTNRNFLGNLQSEFTLKRAPNIMFFCQKTVIPGIFIKSVNQVNPLVDIKHAGDQVYYNEFQVTFLVDELMTNYLELYTWIEKLGFPDDSSQYQSLYEQPIYSGEGPFSDATLTILDSKSNPKLEIELVDCFPVSLSDIEMDTRQDVVKFVSATASFAYTSYELRRLDS